MREIMLMYLAVAVIFVISVAIGFIKSTRVVLVLGGIVTIVAIACGIFMRKQELLNTVLDYVKTTGSSVFATPSEWNSIQLLKIGIIVLIVLLGGVCFVVDAVTKSKSTIVFL